LRSYFWKKKIYFLYHHIKIIQKHQKILIWSKENIKKISNFCKSIFETQKQTCFNKETQSNLKWKKTYHHPTFVQYKKHLINLFSLQYEKKINKRRKKIKLKISLRKKIKGKEISCWCIGHYSIMHYSWCYCRKKKLKMTMVQIHSVLLTQLKHFYILKKYCYWLTAKHEPIC
jgi:hypothetical protein